MTHISIISKNSKLYNCYIFSQVKYDESDEETKRFGTFSRGET